MEDNTQQTTDHSTEHAGHNTTVQENPGLPTTKNVVSEELSPVKGGQFSLQTWWIIGGLVVALLILKTFIYIKDGKRHGK
ncbi:hypothetical protein [Bacteriovorax sp. Seq25_V]|uniref:hypothetical protein n=1 Tax=Bacteriovorax sp. Seq25_V TaxID=1201288 RepID=UPI00038A51D3|nr:hypothetical protein [Bacteriovorax sp. Seq25_V]EQC43525.1 hypothetical protein M900_0292 [Bacteriovorax sp. Seq25_V]